MTIEQELRNLPKPDPSAGVEAYNHERELALAFDPRRRANYEKYLKSARRSAEVDYLPIKADIENVSRCNFKCTMCTVSDWPQGARGADMSLADFKALIDDQYGLVEIKLQGIGEPTLQRDDFFEMIRYARAQYIWVRTTTNASLLHLNDNVAKLIAADPNEIQVSIDGASKDVFETIRRGAVFERIVDNCKLLNQAARDQGKRITKMWTVVQRDNRAQLFDLVNLAHELGFQDQTFAFSLSNWGRDDWRERNDAVTVEDSLSVDIAHQLIAKGKNLGLRVSFWNSTSKYRTGNLSTLCAWPFERGVVTSDLRTVPCCTIGNPDAYEIAPGQGKSFGQLWNSPEYQAFRQAHLDGQIPSICKNCYE